MKTKNSKIKTNTKTLPLVSAVITTKNEEKNIASCLESLRGQDYNNLEIIVVDHPETTDKTREIARKYTNKVFVFGTERSAQRNYGIGEKAKGKYVVFLDADMILGERAVEVCVKMMEADKKLVGLYIPEIVTGESFFSKVRRFERGFYDGTAVDCARFIRRDKFLEVGGFDPKLTGPEDWDFDKKLRQSGKTMVAPAMLYHNEAEFDLKKYLAKKEYYGQSFAAYITKWGANDADIRKQFSPFYRFFGVFLEDGKWRRLLRHPMLAGGMYFLRFMVGLGYLKTKFFNCIYRRSL